MLRVEARNSQAVRVPSGGRSIVSVTGRPYASRMTPVEVAEGIFLLALPLGIHRIPSINAYLLVDSDGDTLVDCGVYAGAPLSTGEVAGLRANQRGARASMKEVMDAHSDLEVGR